MELTDTLGKRFGCGILLTSSLPPGHGQEWYDIMAATNDKLIGLVQAMHHHMVLVVDPGPLQGLEVQKYQQLSRKKNYALGENINYVKMQ